MFLGRRSCGVFGVASYIGLFLFVVGRFVVFGVYTVLHVPEYLMSFRPGNVHPVMVLWRAQALFGRYRLVGNLVLVVVSTPCSERWSVSSLWALRPVFLLLRAWCALSSTSCVISWGVWCLECWSERVWGCTKGWVLGSPVFL